MENNKWKTEIRTSFTDNSDLRKGMYGWFADTQDVLEATSNYEERLRPLMGYDEKNKQKPFISVGEASFLFFYPAPYDVAQKEWVRRTRLKAGDLIEVTSLWSRGDGGFKESTPLDRIYRRIGEVKSINKDYILIVANGSYEHVPYFCIKRTEDSHRRFYDAEEFEDYKDEWFLKKSNSKRYRVFTFSPNGVFFVEGEPIMGAVFYDYKELFEEFTFRDGTPAGVEMSAWPHPLEPWEYLPMKSIWDVSPPKEKKE